jgi:adenylate cyclase
MPSLLPGFEYDIFISYRHNDNRSGWVTDFVNALQEELGATIKKPLSIYFDKNPHDGLLETHSVDKSLEGKLKCLIFIPIISQTYSDPTSFAWQHEFCAFNKLSHQGEIGRDIKLANGNVTSRILPVKIHDLDSEDKIAIENEIGGALRAIEFIFKSPGVNRPLRALEEHPQDNLNNTFYRDQVNKVANAIKAIVQAIKAPSNVQASATNDGIKQSDPPKRQTPSKKLMLAALVLIIPVFIFFWKYNSKPAELAIDAKQAKSLVVLPFEDMSPKKDQEWFSDGLTEELLNSLATLEDLKLISRTTSFSFKDKGLSAKRIADSLGVAHVLEGSVRKMDDQLRVTVQLIKANDDTHLWSHVYEYTIDSVFKIQGDISKNVASTLNVLLDAQTREQMYNAGTTSVEAYQEYLKGKAVYNESHVTGDPDLLIKANKYFERAIQIWPNFAEAYYDHADFFTHSLLAASGVESVGNLSEKQQYDRLLDDLNKAIALSQIPSKKVGYSFTRDVVSNDWSQLTSYIKVKEKWTSGWEAFLALVDPEFVARRYLKAIEIDQFSDVDRHSAAVGLTNMGELDSALLLYKNDITKSNMNGWVKSVLYVRKNDYSKALETIKNLGSDLDGNLTGFILFLQVLNGQYTNGRAELDRLLASQPLFDPYGYSPILIYNALGEYDHADSVASLIDRRILGHCALANHVTDFGLHFHLSVTPNFAARLRELGIDPMSYEKKHYKTLPVMKIAR